MKIARITTNKITVLDLKRTLICNEMRDGIF